MTSKGKLIITSDKEEFTESECACKVCQEMNDTSDTWSTNIPKTQLQKRMKKVVADIEEREKKKKVVAEKSTKV